MLNCGRCLSANSAITLSLMLNSLLFKIETNWHDFCIALMYPAALWFGKASVERRIHSLSEIDPAFCSYPQFSSSFYPRTMLTAQRAFLCAVLDMCFVTTDILIRSSSPKRSQ